jgi:excisionase family DNA binding protein
MYGLMTPDERAIAWADVAGSPSDIAASRTTMLAVTTHELVGPAADLYAIDYRDWFIESFQLLAEERALTSESLRAAFVSVEDGDRDSSIAFLHALSRELARCAAQIEDDDRQDRLLDLSDRWRRSAVDAITGEQSDSGMLLSVAEVAARFDVSPQAVYKWIHRGVIEHEQRPGGSYRIPTAQFDRKRGFDPERARRLRRELVARARTRGEISSDEIVDQIRARRGA